MTIAELKQITDTMGLINRLADKRELPRDKGSNAVIALAELLGCQPPEPAEEVLAPQVTA